MKSSFIIVALSLIGGVAYSAESTLPGSFLYPVKIHVNEPAVGLFSVTNALKAGFDIRSVSRRLVEVEKLSETNKMTNPVLADLGGRFEKNIAEFKEISSKIEAKDPAQSVSVRSDMQSTLEAHNELLKKIDVKESSFRESYRRLLEKLNGELITISDERRASEEKTFVGDGSEAKVAVEKILKVAETKIDDVEKFLESEKEKKRADLTEAEETLKVARAHIAEGKAKFDIPAYGDAFALFKRAEREAVSAKTLVEIKGGDE
jgi:hypothetical protein